MDGQSHSGLVARYPLEDGTTPVTDTSGNGHHLTINGDPQYRAY